MQAVEARVLVVEDDRHIGRLLYDALSEEGYDVRVAANGHRALEILQHERWVPKVIVLDLMMPVMDGWEFRRAQLDEYRLAHIPVLVMSAGHQFAIRREELGDVGIIMKPFELDQMLAAVAELLRARGVRP